jgi:hypothetical protein
MTCRPRSEGPVEDEPPGGLAHDLRREPMRANRKSGRLEKREYSCQFNNHSRNPGCRFRKRKGNTMNRRTALALTIGLSSIGLLAGNGIGHAQQSDADKVKAAIDGFHTAISSLDIRKMDDVWAHEPYAMVVNPRDKTVTVGWDAIRRILKERSSSSGPN